MSGGGRVVLFLGFLLLYAGYCLSFTHPQDFAILESLKGDWKNTPATWGTSDDPCGAPWEGVTCHNSRVTELILPSMGLEGQLSGDIGGLTHLTKLDLSFNKDLTGSLSPTLGDLPHLTTLVLAACGFTGNIPQELGNLTQLVSLALNLNMLSGPIPPTLGKLSKLFLLDLADNQLTGTLPVSTLQSPGLDRLLNAYHFHLSRNKLSGPIPPKLFSSNMALIHLVLDGNQFSGTIPQTLGLVKKLEVLRLDRNSLTGIVPSIFNNLTNINYLNLAGNHLRGPLPNLTQMSSLSVVDLSNNSFGLSTASDWFSSLPTSLTTLIIEYGSMHGSVSQGVFSLPQIQQIRLKNNSFSDILSMGDNISQHLELVDLQNNQISLVTSTSGYSKTLMLNGNPVCDIDGYAKTNYCELKESATKPYSISLNNCEIRLCSPGEKQNPQNCECQYPFQGTFYFRGPLFRVLSNVTLFRSLEESLCEELHLTPGSVLIENSEFNIDDNLQVQLVLFPPSGTHFNRSEIQRISSALSYQVFGLPAGFGSFFFKPDPINFSGLDEGTSTSRSTGLLIGIAIGCTFLVLGLAGGGIYAIKQKIRAEKAIGLTSWASSKQGSGDVPQLKGARYFSYDELKSFTNNFSVSNEIGSGGYGKVYRGMIGDGQVVAIKRAKQGSMQGGHEFKTEIELLSRVHHKNLVNLIGFCFERDEQMLVYEFMPNGTLRESLSGSSGIHLDWKRRLRVALGSAKGLAYLHEFANPPIIHRDVKSTNILLDEYLNAKVGDFGLSKLVFDDEKGHVSTQVKGTLGYLDPAYYTTQQLTEKSDVYSFGVVMLELITSRLPIVKGKYIVREVLMLMNNSDQEHYGLGDLMDTTIRDEMKNRIGFGRFLEMAVKCVEESASNRPTMSEVVKEIENILQNEEISRTELEILKGSPKMKRTSYSYQKEDIEDDDTFDYSGKHTLSAHLEPK